MSKQDETPAWSPSAAREAAKRDAAEWIRSRTYAADSRALVSVIAQDLHFDSVEQSRTLAAAFAGRTFALNAYLGGFAS